MLRRFLSYPLTRDLNLDDPRTTELRREIIRSKPFLRKIYEEWYERISSAVPKGNGPTLEIGSGGGFLNHYIEGLITSDFIPIRDISTVIDAHELPFGDGVLAGIVMCNVLHHLPSVERFLKEATRCVRPTGRLVMIEPWVTHWSTFVYKRFHHEPFDPEAVDWSFQPGGPLSKANGAIPWIVFERDRERFIKEFPEWCIKHIRPCMPFRYLVSGGFSIRSLMPGWSCGLWRLVEMTLQPWMNYLAMFAFIELERKL